MRESMYQFPQHHFDPYHRETATLLGAAMEAQEAPGSEPQSLKLSAFPDNTMKQEPHDDGYETSGDLEIRAQGEAQKLYNPMVAPLGVKPEATNDPYSFVDDDAIPPQHQQSRIHAPLMQPMPKKRGRKKKIKPGEEGLENSENLMNGDPLLKKKKLKEDKPHFKERKKHDRFNGMPEEEVSKRTLPDHLAQNLDIVIIGINPGLFAAYKGHHYAGPGNHFWKCLYLSGITPEPMTADDDYKLLQYGVGFTNMVSRATKGSADLTRKEIKEGSQVLLEKLQKFKPKIAVFNGKLIYEVFSGKKDFSFGRQPDFVDGTNTYMWVMPSSSARCAQLPRAADKVPFYAALKKFRDYLNGIISDLDETEVVFTDSKLKSYTEPELKDDLKDERSFYGYGRLPNNGELTDLSNAIVKKDGDLCPPKKKRGRPKKVKCEGGVEIEPRREGSAELVPTMKTHKNGETPKKKRGRPKKVKMDHDNMITNGLPDHTSSSLPLSSCFSPPIQSPNNFCQNFSPAYNTQSQVYNSQTQSQSPSSAHNYHQSPGQSHRFSQSPQPPSQPFTHSDLSSEISAAISSEHNLGSPPPTSPSLGPPDFEPPTSMPEDTNDTAQNPSGIVKDETSGDAIQNQNECRFSSPTPPNENPAALNYPTYGNFSADSETSSAIGFPQGSTPDYNAKRNMTQDVASKSLSGLESLVDQIPSIAEGETAPHGALASSNNEHYDSAPSSQFNDESAAYLASSYPNSSHYSGSSSSNAAAAAATGNYSPHYSTASTNYSVSTSNSYSSLHHSSASMNFSVSSLANSSSSGNHDLAGQVSSSFSVTSLASNYSPINSSMNSYPNLMGAPHPMGSHMMAAPNGMGSGMFGSTGPMSSMGGGIMERACGMGGSMGSAVGLPNPMSGMNMPYPYSQYSASPSTYTGTPGGGFPYTPSHSLHMPSPNYPYPSPYSNSPYPQAGYLQNHVLDRIKQDRMDIGFGGF